MTHSDEPHPSAEAETHAPSATVLILERLDNLAHVIVAAFFILMAATVILHMSFIFLRQLPYIMPSTPTGTAVSPPATAVSENHAAMKAESKTEASAGEAAPPKAIMAENASLRGAETKHEAEPADPFVKNSLELLSNILFVVILLELLRTIITYLETHNIEAIMQEFLVVGIISSVRKILLVGAEASLVHSNGIDFIREASGVVIDIIGILLLILGLVMLKRAFGSKPQKEP